MREDGRALRRLVVGRDTDETPSRAGAGGPTANAILPPQAAASLAPRSEALQQILADCGGIGRFCSMDEGPAAACQWLQRVGQVRGSPLHGILAINIISRPPTRL
jgi:hypothetical protein